MAPIVFWGRKARGGSKSLSKNNALIPMGDWSELVNNTHPTTPKYRARIKEETRE
jgi:hypothetical protein